MSNPIYEMFGKQATPNNALARFQEFKKTFSGNPQEIIQQMLNSGKVTQAQVNEAMKIANQYSKFLK